jgi:hypothetical protein
LCHYSGYTEEEIEPVFKLMVDYLARPVAHEAFFKKYASKKFLKGKLSSPTGLVPLANSIQPLSSQDNGLRSMLLNLMLMSRFLWKQAPDKQN